jgi:hypothetical protein
VRHSWRESRPGETVAAVASNDDYPLAWVADVACHDQTE